MFSYVQNYYAMGLYTTDDLATLKNGGMITLDEYNQLIGDTTPDSQSTSESTS
ncbi:XkdX family protein [Pediococcus pentosaceus]|uniref:XkdX family protein n=1 Tax=Pediococcus pentosaceus TaxID=1255 RepID=UPI002380B5CF|nr:XkdX family protein [Pediococcus pentosaceus]MDE3751888.1 XkdX family protein [Pediococcus pentosaceus]